MNQKTLLGLFLILLPFVGFTQGVDSTHLHTLEEVEVKTQRKELDLLNLNSSNISKQMLLESFSNTFVQALDRLPGINSISTGVGIAKPVIRGLTSNRVIVTEYNIKQEGQQWGLDHGLEIDAMNVDKVEILKGPVSLLYGSDGIGGVINISATEPILDNQYKFQILTHYKSNNNGWGGSFKIEKNWGPIFL